MKFRVSIKLNNSPCSKDADSSRLSPEKEANQLLIMPIMVRFLIGRREWAMLSTLVRKKSCMLAAHLSLIRNFKRVTSRRILEDLPQEVTTQIMVEFR